MTDAQCRAYATNFLLETILELVGKDGIPNGHAYAVLMASVNLHVYQQMVGFLKGEHAIEESGFYFTRGESYEAVLKRVRVNLEQIKQEKK